MSRYVRSESATAVLFARLGLSEETMVGPENVTRSVARSGAAERHLACSKCLTPTATYGSTMALDGAISPALRLRKTRTIPN
jgi:hypothetical protein